VRRALAFHDALLKLRTALDTRFSEQVNQRRW